MIFLKNVLIICFLFCISGCGKFDIVNNPVPEITHAPSVCIIDHPETREGFKGAIGSWLTENGIEYSIIPANSRSDACDWTLRYYGRWSWDLALFLADAEISAYKKGTPVGKVNLRVGQWDAHKFESGEQRIHKMMDMLSGKVDRYVQPKAKKSTVGE